MTHWKTITTYAATVGLVACTGSNAKLGTASDSLSGVTGAVAFVATVAQLRAGSFSGSVAVDLCGYHACGDGGGGRFVVTPAAAGCLDNGGSTFVDSAGNCLTRVTSTFSPREWGAWGDGTCHDTQNDCDTSALQSWLSSKALPNDPSAASQQPRIGVSGTYVVTQTLDVPANTTLIGTVNSFTNGDKGSVNQVPNFAIVAANGKNGAQWQAGDSLLHLHDLTHLAGVALVADSDAPSPGIHGVFVDGFHIVIDQHTSVIGGNDGIHAERSGDPAAGLQIKDCQIITSGNYGLYLHMPNARIVGNIIQGAKTADLYYTGDEVTIANNMIEDCHGDGVVLADAHMVKLTGNQLNDNGRQTGTGYGVRILGGTTNVALTGNLFNKNCYERPGGGGGAHVFVDATTKPIANVSFSGGVYTPSPDGQHDASTDFVFDAAGDPANVTGLQLYEKPVKQVQGVYTAAALAVFGLPGGTSN